MVTRAASRIAVPTAVDDAVGVKQDVIDRELVLKGKFDAEIKRLTALKADAEETLSAVGGLKEAQKILAEADERAAKVNAEAERLLAEASAKLTAAKAREKTLAEREHAVSLRELSSAATLERTEARAKDIERIGTEAAAANAARLKELDQMTAELSRLQAIHVAAVATLTEREKRLNARLDSLKITDV